MAKIRTVKPELFRHPGLYEAEKKYQLPIKLAFIGLFTCCDREGRFKWEPRVLKLDVLPYDEIDFERILEALWHEGFIQKYTYQNKHYAYIPSWHNHQSINKHEPLSKLPDPLKCELTVADLSNANQCTEMHMQTHAMHAQPSAMHIPLQPSSTHVEPLAHTDNTTALAPTVSLNHQASSSAGDIAENNAAEHVTSTTKPANTYHQPSLSNMHMYAHALHEPNPETNMHTSLEVEVEVEVEREREYEMEMGEIPNIVAPARRRSNHEKNIAIVFHHWKTTLQHPNALLDQKRNKLIKHALDSGYSVEQLCDAITGCAQTPHNMGKNDRGQLYNGLHVILRDADQIERFIHNCYNPPQPSSTANQLLESNISAGKNWLTYKQDRRTKHEK